MLAPAAAPGSSEELELELLSLSLSLLSLPLLLLLLLLLSSIWAQGARRRAVRALFLCDEIGSIRPAFRKFPEFCACPNVRWAPLMESREVLGHTFSTLLTPNTNTHTHFPHRAAFRRRVDELAVVARPHGEDGLVILPLL